MILAFSMWSAEFSALRIFMQKNNATQTDGVIFIGQYRTMRQEQIPRKFEF